MTATDAALTMHPVVESVMIARVKDGEVVESELLVGFTPGTPALLSIGEGWKPRRQTFRHFATYEVYRQPIAEGRQFRLVRDEATVERERKADPTAPDFYFVTYFPDGRVECDCRGHYATETRAMECKHSCCVRHLLSLGHL